MDYRKSSFGLILLLGLYVAPSFATEVNHYSSDDGSTQFNLPFDFELYGQSFDTAKMYTNGVVQFGDQGYQHFCCHGEEYGGTGYYQQSYDISYSIMPLWTDIIANRAAGAINETNGRQYTENNGTSFTFGWENIREYNRQSTNTFDVTIDDTGSWYVEYDAVDILNHHVTVGSVGDYSAQEWDQYTYRTGNQDTTLSDVNGYTGYTVEQEETTLIQFTNDGICDFTAIDDPDCVVIEETFVVDQIFGDENNENNENTNNYGEDWEIVNESIEEPVDNSNSDSTIASDGQDSGNIVGDTGENIVYITEEPEMVEQPEMEVIVEQEQTIIGIDIDPNALLQSDTLFSKNQQSSSFRRSINSRSINHLNSVGGLPQIGATSAETYTMMQNSASMNGVMMSEALSLDPSKMLLPSNPMDPTGTGIVVSDSTGVMNGYNPMNNYDNFKFDQSGNEFNDIVASISSPIEEVELVESLDIDDLGNLDISDFNQIQLKDNNNWYSNSNILEQSGIYQDQEFYKQQEIYKGVRWYGNN